VQILTPIVTEQGLIVTERIKNRTERAKESSQSFKFWHQILTPNRDRTAKSQDNNLDPLSLSQMPRRRPACSKILSALCSRMEFIHFETEVDTEVESEDEAEEPETLEDLAFIDTAGNIEENSILQHFQVDQQRINEETRKQCADRRRRSIDLLFSSDDSDDSDSFIDLTRQGDDSTSGNVDVQVGVHVPSAAAVISDSVCVKIEILLNDDYDGWSAQDVIEAKKFDAGDFTHGRFLQQKSKKGTLFHDQTGVYELLGDTKKRKTAGMFYDKRVNGYREFHEQIKFKSQGPLYFGVEHSMRYPLRFFSITLSVKGGDLPLCTWNEFNSNFVQIHCFRGIITTERGNRNHNRHLHSAVEIFCATDNEALKEVNKVVKSSVSITAKEGLSVCIKGFSLGDIVGRRRCLGYIQKDSGKSWYRMVNHNFDSNELKSAADEFNAESGDPFKQRLPITATNVLSLAHRFYLESFEGLPPPNINTMVKYMVQSGRFLLSPLFAKMNMRI